MNFNDLMRARRSVRGFTDQPLTDEEITKLLEAATSAPNACNYQSWHFYVARGRETIDGFVPAVFRGEWFRGAAAVFVVCTDAPKLAERFGERGTGLFAIQDTACAVDHLMLMAAELGLGSCFVGAFDEGECKKYLNIPDARRPVALIPVGHPAANLPKRARKPLGEVVTFVGGGELSERAPDEKKHFALRSASIPGAMFDDLNLARSTFNNINMKGAGFSDINMTGALFRSCDLRGVKIESSDVGGMTVDGKDISELIKNRD